MAKSILDRYKAKREEPPAFEVRQDLTDLVKEHGGKIEAGDLAILDADQQDLVFAAFELLEPAIDRTRGVHSAEYYRAMFIDGFPGFEQMTYEAQLVSATVCLGKWRKDNPDVRSGADEGGGIEGGFTSPTLAGDVPSVDQPDAAAAKGNDQACQGDGDSANSASKSMMIVGIDDNIYEISTEEGGGVLAVSACAFGIGKPYEIARIDLGASEDPNFAHLDLVDAIDGCKGDPDFLEAIPALGGGTLSIEDVRDAACNALNYAIEHMGVTDRAIIMPKAIKRVMGKEDPAAETGDDQAPSSESAMSAMQKAITFAEKHGLTHGDVMGAFFRCGNDWSAVIDYLKAVYEIEEDGDAEEEAK